MTTIYHLQFYNNYNKPDQNTEPDSYETDQALNTVLANAQVDQWQHGRQLTHQATHPDADNEFHCGGPQVSMVTAVAAGFVNTQVTRSGEPDFVPLTTNLGLKYERQMLYFPMDFGELTLDGLVDTGALPSSIREADLCIIIGCYHY